MPKELLGLLPIVVGALVAGLSAVVKTVYERRDDRLTAHRQLELAAKRTGFVSGWVQACRSVASDDDAFVATADRRARAELEEAFEEAQHALANGQTALRRSDSTSFGQQVASVMLLEPRRSAASYVVVITYYLVVIALWLAVVWTDPKVVDDRPNPDYMVWWQYALIAAATTIVLRFPAGALVGWLERRPSSSRAGRADPVPPPPPPGSAGLPRASEVPPDPVRAPVLAEPAPAVGPAHD